MSVSTLTNNENTLPSELTTDNATLSFSVRVAREHGIPAAILYSYLQDKQEEYEHYGDKFNTRWGFKWIPKHSYEQIQSELAVFPSKKTVEDAADTLEEAGMIARESTGAFLERSHETGRKRDLATWWRVGSTFRLWSEPVEFRVCDAQKHGIAQALILSHWRTQAEVEGGHRKLSAVDLEKALPMDERTARRHLKALLAAGVLILHPNKPKLYRLG